MLGMIGAYRFNNGGAVMLVSALVGGVLALITMIQRVRFTAVNTAVAETLLFYFYAPKPASRQLPEAGKQGKTIPMVSLCH